MRPALRIGRGRTDTALDRLAPLPSAPGVRAVIAVSHRIHNPPALLSRSSIVSPPFANCPVKGPTALAKPLAAYQHCWICRDDQVIATTQDAASRKRIVDAIG